MANPPATVRRRVLTVLPIAPPRGVVDPAPAVSTLTRVRALTGVKDGGSGYR
jgi:hypothetical protein